MSTTGQGFVGAADVVEITPGPAGPVMVNQPQLAREQGVTVNTIRRWRRLRILPPAVKIRGNIYFLRADIERWRQQLPAAELK